MKYIQSSAVKLRPFVRHILILYKLILVESLKISCTCLIYKGISHHAHLQESYMWVGYCMLWSQPVAMKVCNECKFNDKVCSVEYYLE